MTVYRYCLVPILDQGIKKILDFKPHSVRVDTETGYLNFDGEIHY